MNGKLYIGKTNNPRQRWASHRSIAKIGVSVGDSFSYLHKGIRKHGAENFEFQVIGKFETEQEVFDAEIFLISKLRELNVSIYNLSNGGDGPNGLKHSEETRRKMSQNRKGKMAGKNHPLFGIGHTEETRNLMSVMAKIRSADPDYINPQQGKIGKLSTAFGRTGDKHPNIKVSEKDLILMKIDLQEGKMMQKEIAIKYNVSDAMVSGIKNNKTRDRG